MIENTVTYENTTSRCKEENEMKKRMIALLLSTVMTVSGVTVPVWAEDFSDSEIVFDEDAGETDAKQSSEIDESEGDFVLEDTNEPEVTEEIPDENEYSVPEENEDVETEDVDMETPDFTSEPEEALFSDAAETAEVEAVGSIGGNIRWNYPANIIPTDTNTAGAGNILLGVKGSYLAGANAALKLINEYRWEACKKGYPDPRNPSRKLTTADYVPIKWSSDLEYIARIRAAEASVVAEHTRTNGESCFSLTSPNGVSSSGEVLAWNSGSDSMNSGIEQWYSEKDTWIKHGNGVTGHYTQMIDPDNLYVGIGAFVDFKRDMDDAWPYTCAGEFSGTAGLDETQAPAISNCTQIVEVEKKGIKPSITFSVSDNVMRPKKSAQAFAGYEVEYVHLVYVNNVTGNGGITWKSSNNGVAVIDQKGKITSKAIGKTTITALFGGMSASNTLTVKKIRVHIGYTDVWVDNLVYTGGNVKPSLTLKYENEKLKSGRDFTYTYSKASKAGANIYITINGKGDYYGTLSGYAKITRKPIKKLRVKGLSASKTYTGKNITQKISVYDGKKKLKSSDYTVKYYNNRYPGKVTVKIIGKGNYSGTITRTFRIVPAKMKNPSLKAGKRKITVSYRKAAGVTGYQIAYSMNKKKFQYVTVNAKQLNTVLNGLKSKRDYYVKVRAYKTIDGKNYYGAFSALSRVRVK